MSILEQYLNDEKFVCHETWVIVRETKHFYFIAKKPMKIGFCREHPPILRIVKTQLSHEWRTFFFDKGKNKFFKHFKMESEDE